MIYVDTCLVIYGFENHALYGTRVLQAFGKAAAAALAISPLVKLECLVGPMRSGNLVLQRHYELGLEQFTVLPLPEPVFIQAAALRARFGLRTPDALHLAAAQYHRCDAFWTNDDRLAHAARGLAITLLAAPV